MNNILILPWGNPRTWREVQYVFKDHKRKSESTLPLLLESINPSRTIIIVLDTIAESGESYTDVVNNTRDFCLEFISNELGVEKQVDVIVAPGVGEFPNGVFKGDMKDFYSYVLFKLSQTFPIEDVTIHLDLTHGLNYMPSLTYRAVREIAGISSLCKRVKFVVYNSEPYIRNKKFENKKLSIHMVESSLIKSTPSLDAVSHSKNYSNL